MRWIVNFFKALLGICETESLKSDLWAIEDGTVTLNLDEMPELCEKGKGIFLKGHGLKRPILVVRTESDTYLAYTNRCTHFGHRKLDPIPGPDPNQPILRCCSVNHSQFDCEGNRLSGPAKDPLVRHEVGLSDGKLVITLTVPAAEEAAPEAEGEQEAPAELSATEERPVVETEAIDEPAAERTAVGQEPVAQAETETEA